MFVRYARHMRTNTRQCTTWNVLRNKSTQFVDSTSKVVIESTTKAIDASTDTALESAVKALLVTEQKLLDAKMAGTISVTVTAGPVSISISKNVSKMADE